MVRTAILLARVKGVTGPVPCHLRNPRRAYDKDGREIVPPTGGALRARGETTAALFCEAPGCRHHAVISTALFPDDLPFPDIVLKVRCGKCGSRHVTVQKDIEAHYGRCRVSGQGVG